MFNDKEIESCIYCGVELVNDSGEDYVICESCHKKHMESEEND